ncbi:NAD(P)/FAD-dependent oxidoreductase (plasmid) [Nocardioides sp. R1-1]|uniref:NAD(P)/FAD-dependent oxidoreductase n=1 Tax=Nocardioides sp. R1-1 TaxID=3383502 RepID=UPI0038D120CA
MNRVVIVGGGIGGVATAAALRSGGYAGEVVLVDRGEFPYDRPPLSKEYLAGARDLKEIALQEPGWYADNRIELVPSSAVVGLSPAHDAVTVTLDDGRVIAADRAVLATGGRAALPPIAGLEDARGAGRAHVLREHTDADALRAALVPGARLLVVGGGLIGAEAASTAVRLGCAVVLVDPLDPPLLAAAGSIVATWLHAQHTALGIETITGTLSSLQVSADAVAAQLAHEADPRAFDAVLIGVGMVPDTALAETAGLEVDRGVLVDDLRVTSHPRVLAVGDASRCRDNQRTEHWEAAQHDGQRAAATILGTPAPVATAPWWWSDRHGRHVEGVGEMREPDAITTVVTRGVPGDAPFSVFTVQHGRVIGAVGIDATNDVRAARRMIDRGIEVDAERLADTEFDLRKLLRG